MSFWFKKKDGNGVPYGCVFRVGEDDDSDIDDSRPPATAEEYLRRGMREVKNLTAIADPKRDEHRRMWSIPPNPTHVERTKDQAPESCIPTREWQIQQLEEFSKFRRKLSNDPLDTESQVPLESSEKEWCVLCFGDEFWVQVDDARNSNDQGKKRRKKSLVAKKGNPSPELLSKIRGKLGASLIAMHLSWAETVGLKVPEQALWIYSILGILGKPISPEVASDLRSIALICSKERSLIGAENPELKFDDGMLSHFNTILTIVSHFFQQFDLADIKSLGDDPEWKWQDEGV